MGFDIIMAGCGAISRRWLDYLTTRKDARIAAIVETNPAPAEAAKVSLALNVRLAPNEKAHFDNVCIYRLTYSSGKETNP